MGHLHLDTWHTVKQGEWLSKIAASYGLPWKLIWDHPKNASLKQRRDPNILFPGDQIFIPSSETREESRNTDKKHDFVIEKQPDFFELTLLYPGGEPIKDEPYTLHITDPPLTGTTDGNGHFKHENLDPMSLHDGLLELPGVGVQMWVGLGTLNPSHSKAAHSNEPSRYDDGLSGIQMRLLNLGYDPGSTDGQLDESGEIPAATERAIAQFQRYEMKLPPEKVTGELDDDTRQAIKDKFGV
ncbi:MAG: peptidoglycan-binding protein [Terriglobales bacterium]